MLNTTLNAMITNNPASIKAIKAGVIIVIVIAGSPVIKEKLSWLAGRLRGVQGRGELR